MTLVTKNAHLVLKSKKACYIVRETSHMSMLAAIITQPISGMSYTIRPHASRVEQIETKTRLNLIRITTR